MGKNENFERSKGVLCSSRTHKQRDRHGHEFLFKLINWKKSKKSPLESVKMKKGLGHVLVISLFLHIIFSLKF